MSYEVQVVRDRNGLQSVLPEWREFLGGVGNRTNFFSDPAIIEFDVNQDGVTPHIVLVRREGKLLCIAPFRLQSSQFRVQLSVFRLASVPVRLMSLFGSDFLYSRDADVGQCCSLVFQSFEQAEFDLSLLQAIDTRSLLWEYCAAENGKPRGLHFARTSRTEDKAFELQLTQGFDEYLTTMGASTRSSLKRRIKKLFTEHSATLLRITSADQIRTFLDNCELIFSDSWQAMTYGPVKKNSEAEVERMNYIANQGWLRCYLLSSDVGPLAFQFGYQYGDTYYACDFAFARKWSHLGPGAALMYLMLKDLHEERRPRVAELGAGDSPQKRTFRASLYNVGDYYIIRRNKWRYLIGTQRCLHDIEVAVQSVLVRTGADKAVRRFLKHKN